ncbi:hypothetical protein DFA_11097 [Cavenderia fasciculata]|uniref:Ankyrin repeat-containing protein n=1 Tax=Cavenderia fasciculata TaxID=261658 RepID=F4QES5_CACFS|nr:uncharacterized protein DFA_11097 [Cavenderia fasciculata]EGG13336.1 hypothetical protein DFA_11097 [Cavenderia fasciculata]|eukprot:XP_004350040.1 hypothetical protein DFA_11097 [Cavenderia fasciculata]
MNNSNNNIFIFIIRNRYLQNIIFNNVKFKLVHEEERQYCLFKWSYDHWNKVSDILKNGYYGLLIDKVQRGIPDTVCSFTVRDAATICQRITNTNHFSILYNKFRDYFVDPSLLELACRGGNIEIIDILLNQTYPIVLPQSRSYIGAAMGNHIHVLDHLLEKMVPFDRKNDQFIFDLLTASMSHQGDVNCLRWVQGQFKDNQELSPYLSQIEPRYFYCCGDIYLPEFQQSLSSLKEKDVKQEFKMSLQYIIEHDDFTTIFTLFEDTIDKWILLDLPQEYSQFKGIAKHYRHHSDRDQLVASLFIIVYATMHQKAEKAIHNIMQLLQHPKDRHYFFSNVLCLVSTSAAVNSTIFKVLGSKKEWFQEVFKVFGFGSCFRNTLSAAPETIQLDFLNSNSDWYLRMDNLTTSSFKVANEFRDKFPGKILIKNIDLAKDITSQNISFVFNDDRTGKYSKTIRFARETYLEMINYILEITQDKDLLVKLTQNDQFFSYCGYHVQLPFGSKLNKFMFGLKHHLQVSSDLCSSRLTLDAYKLFKSRISYFQHDPFISGDLELIEYLCQGRNVQIINSSVTNGSVSVLNKLLFDNLNYLEGPNDDGSWLNKSQCLQKIIELGNISLLCHYLSISDKQTNNNKETLIKLIDINSPSFALALTVTNNQIPILAMLIYLVTKLGLNFTNTRLKSLSHIRDNQYFANTLSNLLNK